jgi:hypothetical protein
MAQEKELIADPRLLVVAVAAMNHIPYDAIVEEYAMDGAEVTKYLLRLDKIGFLELLPNNRVKLLISRTFSWIADGPIQNYFRSEAAADFLNSRFDGELETMRLVNVMLSKKSSMELMERLAQVANEFSQLHQHEMRLPLERRHAVSLMLAARPWIPKSFQNLRRN